MRLIVVLYQVPGRLQHKHMPAFFGRVEPAGGPYRRRTDHGRAGKDGLAELPEPVNGRWIEVLSCIRRCS